MNRGFASDRVVSKRVFLADVPGTRRPEHEVQKPERWALKTRTTAQENAKGPNLEKIQADLEFSISLENFDILLENSISTFRISHQKRGLDGWLA